MKALPEHPAIARALRCGDSHRRANADRSCPRCGGEPGRVLLEAGGELVCQRCFADWLWESGLLLDEPEAAARAYGLDVAHLADMDQERSFGNHVSI